MIKGVVDVLVQSAGVGAICANRIYPDRAKQTDVFPFIVVSMVSQRADDDKDGVSDLDIGEVQVSSFATTSGGAFDLNEAARTALERYSGTNKTIVIQSIRYLNTVTLYEEDARVFHYATRYQVREDKS